MAAAPVRRLAADSGGAIMVMGVFMACIVVAGVWYAIGIGNAMLLRDRAQEASDAAAFTAAAVHAKGMNLLVLLNLTMAAILSIRVILKSIFTIATIALSIFSVICAIEPFGAWACPIDELAADVVAMTRAALTATKEPIDAALAALTKSEEVVTKVLPPAAVVASAALGEKYRPRIRMTVAVAGEDLLKGLPVEAGTPQKLCGKAADSIGGMLAFIFEKMHVSGKLGSFIGGALTGIVKAGPMFFCELAPAPSPKNLHDQVSTIGGDAGETIDSAVQQKCDKDKADWEGSHKGLKYPSGNMDKCKTAQKDKMQHSLPDATGPSAKIAPRMLSAGYGNGCDPNQSIGLAEANTDMFARDSRMVAVGNFMKRGGESKTASITSAAGAIGGVLPDAWTQSEFFYDCAGPWPTHMCRGDGEEPMWHFHWRPRLRLFNNSMPAFRRVVTALEVAYKLKMTDTALSADDHITLDDMTLIEETAAMGVNSNIFVH